MLDAGFSLSDVTAALCERWQPGVRLLPMTDDRCETHVVVELDGARKAIHFQEWWIRHRAGAAGRRRSCRSALDDAEPAPGVLEAITTADVVLVAPSNPVVSIGTILGVPEHPRGARRRRRPRSSACRRSSAARRCAAWPTRACPRSASRSRAEGVGRHYGARKDGGLLDGWLIHDTDTADVPGRRRCARSRC